MKNLSHFKARHVNATSSDLAGNGQLGRYLLLPGSDGRAKAIAEHFDQVKVKSHPRGHNLYIGQLHHAGQNIDVATVASGMGCPSMEIILHELFNLGAKRFLRLGTAGSLQPKQVKIGDIINVQASVRDEQTSLDYAPLALPAVASFELVSAIHQANRHLSNRANLHTGIVHCKSSLYAREFFVGPQAESNKQFNSLMKDCGVLATEMETATLFIQSHFYNQQLKLNNPHVKPHVLSGAILGIIAVPTDEHASPEEEHRTIEDVIVLGLATVKQLASDHE